MEADELAEVDLRLRRICAQRGLAWVVSSVDELVSEGQYILEPQEYQQHRGAYEFSRYGSRAAPGKRPDPAEFRVAPFSPADRTLLLIDAMLAVFADLSNAQSSALRTLRQGWNGRAPVVGYVSFAESDGGSAAVISDDTERDYGPVITILRDLRAAVVDQ